MIQPKQFGKDTQLRTRMFITMLLLGVLYGVFIYFALLSGLTWMLGIVVVIVLIQFAASDKMVLASMRAKVVTREDAPLLVGMVERLSRDAGIPMQPSAPVTQIPC